MKSKNCFWMKYLHCQNKRHQQEMCHSMCSSLTGWGASPAPPDPRWEGSPLARGDDSRWQNIWRCRQRRCLCKVGEGPALQRAVSTASPGVAPAGRCSGGGGLGGHAHGVVRCQEDLHTAAPHRRGGATLSGAPEVVQPAQLGGASWEVSDERVRSARLLHAGCLWK